MSNVIQFPGKVALAPTPVQVISALASLSSLSIIDQHALHLGLQVASKAAQQGTRVVGISLAEASTTCVTYTDGQLMAGPLPSTLPTFIAALQKLHFAAGIYSSLEEALLSSLDAADRHFTRNPGHAGPQPLQPVYFALPSVPAEAYIAGVEALMLSHMTGRIQHTIVSPCE